MAQKVPCNVSKGINSDFKTINATCSCTKCDSFCFLKRHDTGSCSCEDCRESKTCLYYNNRMIGKESHSHTMTSATGDNVQSKYFTRNINSTDAMTNTYDPRKYISGLFKKDFGAPRSTSEPWKNTCTSCATDAMTNTYERPKTTLELSKNIYQAPRSVSESCKNIYTRSNYKSDPNCGCEDPWNTIEQPDNKYLKKGNCDCDDPWDTIERPGNKYFPKKQYYCDCIDPPKNASKPKKLVSDPPGYILNVPKPEPVELKNKLRTQMDTIKTQNNKCLPNSDDCNCKEPTTTLKLSINILGAPINQTETQKNTYVPQKNNCNCKTSSKHIHDSSKRTYDHQKHKHDSSNNKQKYAINRQETKTFEILNKTFQQKLIDCNDLLRSFNTSELPGYVLELPKRAHESRKNKLDLCKNILENQRYAMKTLNQMTLPQDSSCNCNEIQKHISEPGYYFESQKHSYEPAKRKHELCNDIFGKQQNTIDIVDNKYLRQNSICICEGLSKNISEKTGYMNELQKYKEPFNKTQKESCNCDDSQKNTSESPGYIFELQKYKHKPSNKTLDSSCHCDGQTKQTSESPGYIFAVQKYSNEPTKGQELMKNRLGTNTNTSVSSEIPKCIGLQKFKFDTPNKMLDTSCNCYGSGKKISEPSGYILELQKHRRNPSNKPQEDSCHCDGSAKQTSESPGYIFALQKYSHEPTKGQEFFINRLETDRTKMQSLNIINQKRSCSCGDPPKNTSESPGYIFELQKYKNNPSNKPLDSSCHCDGQAKQTSESPGYIFAVQKYSNEPTKGQELMKNRLGTNTNTTVSSEIPKCIGLQKFKFDTPNKMLDTSCNCYGSGKKISEPSGYILELQKHRRNLSNKPQEDSCHCDGSAKQTSESPGYIFALQKYSHEPTKGQEFFINRLETDRTKMQSLNIINQKRSCSCGDPPKNTSESPGYIFELQKYKNNPSNKPLDSSCHCDGQAKQTSESPGYIFAVQKYSNEPTKGQELMKNRLGTNTNTTVSSEIPKCIGLQKFKFDTPNKMLDTSCNCYGSGKKISEPSGYILELQKHRRNPINKPQEDSCHCDRSAKQTSESPGYIFALQKYSHEPTKGQEFFINRLETDRTTIQSLNLINQKRSCSCGDPPNNTSESPGYIFELQKYKPSNKTLEKSCNCDGQAKQTSESPGYIFALQKYSNEPTKGQELLKNKLGTNTNTSFSSEIPKCIGLQKFKFDTPNKMLDTSCNCYGSGKKISEPSGYILELQKHRRNPSNKTQEDSCHCDGSAKQTSESPGYIFALQKFSHEPTKGQEFLINRFETNRTTTESFNNINQKRSCSCGDTPNNTSESPGYIFELQKYKNKPSNKTLDSSCHCDGQTKQTSESPGYIFTLQKYSHEPMKGQESLINRLGTRTNTNVPSEKTSETPKCIGLQKYKLDSSNKSLHKSCNCYGSGKKISDPPGYILDIQKHKHEPSNKTLERSCNCDGSAKRTSESPGYIFEVQKHKHEPSNNTLKNCCNCDGSAKRRSESPGYIFALQKYSHEPTKGQEFLINRFETNTTRTESFNKINQKRSCSCGDPPKNTSESPGYIFELQKYKNKPSNKTLDSSCHCNGQAKQTSESPGYIFALQKYSHEPMKGQESLINRLGTQTNTNVSSEKTSETPKCIGLQKYKLDTSKSLHTSCNCYGSGKKISDPPGYILEIQKHRHEPSNNTLEHSCNCDGSAKRTSETPGYIFELQKHKHEPSNNTLKNCCNCDGSAKHTSETPGYIYDLQKYTQEPTKKQEFIINRLETKRNAFESFYRNSKKNSFNNDHSAKLTSGPPGYIFELHKYISVPTKKQEFIINTVETTRNIDSLNETFQENDCICDDLLNNPSEAPGYIYELQKHNHETSNKIQELLINRLDTTRNTIESLNETYQKNSLEYDDVPINISEPPGYILDIQNNTIETLDNTIEKKKCFCNKPLRKISESPGYTYGLQKYKYKPSNQELKNILETQRITIETLNNSYKKQSSEWDDLLINVSEPPGYILDVQKNTIEPLDNTHEKKKCNCNKPLRKISESPGYTYGLQKYKYKPSNQELKNILETQRITIETLNNSYKKQSSEWDDLLINVSEPPGYILDVQKNTIEPLNNTHEKKKCDCNKPLRKISESPGYIYGLQKYKYKPSNQELKNILETQRITIETLNNSYKKQSSEWDDLLINVSEPPGYILDVQKNIIEPLNNTDEKKKCDCNKPLSKISESPGYIYGLQKYKYKPSNQELKNILETQRITIETLNNSYKKQSSEWDDLQINVSGPPGYILDVQKNTIESLDNTHEKKKCDCNKPLRKISESPGYIYGLQKYKHGQSNNCNCNESSRRTSKSVGYIFELPKHTNETQRNTTETLNNTDQKDSCNCNESSGKTFKSSEYIFELPKNNNKLSNNTKGSFENIIDAHKNTCSCKELPRKSSQSPGYISELQKYDHEPSTKYQKNSCSCDKSTRKTSELPGYILELQKYDFKFSSNTQELNTNSLDTQKYSNKLKSCNCNESSRKTSISSGYEFNLSKHTNELSNNTQEICKNILEVQRNTIETLNYTYQKKSCSCKESPKTLSESPGYVFELRKYGHEPFTKTMELSKNTLETQKYTNKLKNCNCNEPSRKTSISSGYVFELSKNIVGNHKNKMEPVNTKYLPQENSCNCNYEETKNTREICQNKLGAPQKSLEAFKNIYLPPKNTPLSDHNVKDTSTRKELNPGTAMLSAEVMNMPYKDFSNSLANKQTDLPKKVSKLSKYDIFKRIKEAYKACSCKVCECIAGKSINSEVCQCKPCECTECLSYLNKLDSKLLTTILDYDKFPCDQCKRGQSKSTAEWQTCDCKPCDCIQCAKNIAKHCDCEPCQCIECKSMMVHQPRTLVVAPVGENIQRVACTCSPCDCIDCGQGYPAASSFMHEMSTGTNRHALCRCENCLNETCDQGGVDSCKCERRNKVMSKPVEKDTHDYDIRTATIVQNNIFQRSGKKGSNKHDTIAMFAAINNKYPTVASNDNRHSKTKPCSCEECECIACVCKEDAYNAIKSSKLFSSKKTISDLIVRNKPKLNCPSKCKCKSCECQICDKSSHTSQKDKNSCVCDVCDCIKCEGETRTKNSLNSLCICNSCGCAVCDDAKMSRDHSFGRHHHCSVRTYEHVFPGGSPPNSTMHTLKRGEVLTPSSHQSKVQSLMLRKSHFEVSTSSMQRVSSNNDLSIKKIRDISYYALSKHDYPENSKQPSEFTAHTNMSELNHFERRYVNTMKKCDPYMQCNERNKGKYLLKNNSVDNEISGSYFSGYSSLETSSKASCQKDYGSISQISQNKNKSWESSCNSSGHDYPEYLIQFPRSTVETCLKDVMKLDIEKTIKLDKFNFIPKRHVYKTTYDNVSGNENLSQAHECNFLDPSNSKLLLTKRTKYTNRYKTRNDSGEVNLPGYTSWDPNFTENDDCRNYNFELSNSLHLNKQFDNNKLYEHNEPIQTKQINQPNASECIKERKSSLKINSDVVNHKYYDKVNVAHKMFDYVSDKKIISPSFSIQNEGYSTLRYSKQMPNSYFVCGVDILNIDDDNKRAQKTLQEAKEFSSELMKLLEMYEKANTEFESISEKLKISHESLLSDDFFGRKEIRPVHASILGKSSIKEERFNEVAHGLQEIHLEVPSAREDLTSTSVSHDSRKIPERTFVECENDNNMILQKRGLTNLNRNNFNYENENNSLQTYDPPERLNTFENEEQGHIMENHDDIIQNGLKTAYTLEKPKEKGSFHEIKDNQGVRKKDRMNSKSYKKYSKLLKRTIIISKRISIKNSSPRESKPVMKYGVTVGTSTSFELESNDTGNNKKSTLIPVTTSVKDTKGEHLIKKYRKCDLDQIMKKLDTVFGSIVEASVSTSTDTHGLDKEENSLNDLEYSAEIDDPEEAKPWPILKKNFTWNTTPYTKNKEVCLFPPLELQIKQAVQSISLQTTEPKKKFSVPHHENKALAKLQTEVKNLLDMPILQPVSANVPVNCRAGCTKDTLKSKLELKVKETPEVSLQTMRKDVKKEVDNEVRYNYTKEDLSALIKKLPNLPDLRPMIKKKIKSDDKVGTTSRISSIGSSNSNCGCEALKVGFLGVRRVSDHTVLVKWNVPRVLTKVQGYELLVDGRAVQKIFSPSKSMAVVTCLPHTDKVLLTIRTITSSVSLTGHYPATTIIYRPRVK